ncbi:MAG TPA: hypothetical protein VMP38_03280 [Candidatus Acidoferrum sp.]|nr:hypothetical protein [Candidatus Acidoferrum sp.]
MNRYVAMALTALVSLVGIAGGAYLSVASAGEPTKTQVIGAIVTGLVAAAKAAQDLMTAPPP